MYVCVEVKDNLQEPILFFHVVEAESSPFSAAVYAAHPRLTVSSLPCEQGTLLSSPPICRRGAEMWTTNLALYKDSKIELGLSRHTANTLPTQ